MERRREIENFAAAEIGMWDEYGNAYHHRALIAPRMSF
jgi:hypothetical protein